MKTLGYATSLALSLAAGVAPAAGHETLAALTEQVRSTEIAFARTMADRDLAAFGRFLAQDAVFVATTVWCGGASAMAAGASCSITAVRSVAVRSTQVEIASFSDE